MSSLSYLKVEESFTGKIGTTQDYAWLYEGLENIESLSDEEIRDYLDEQAGTIYDRYDADCIEADREALSFEEWKSASDYEDAVQAVLDARDNQRDQIARHTYAIEVYADDGEWQVVHQSLSNIPHYWDNRTLMVNHKDVVLAVEALNALGIETDEDGSNS